MPRKSGVWYRRSVRSFYTKMNGNQLKVLGPVEDTPENRAVALSLLPSISARHPATDALTTLPVAAVATRTVGSAVADYLGHCSRRLKLGKLHPDTMTNYRRILSFLAADFGPRPLSSLAAEDLEDWAARPAWSSSYQNAVLSVVQQVLKFGGVRLRVARPPKESRGASSVLTPDQFAALVADLEKSGQGGDLAQILRFLWETGFRPQEAAQLRCEAVDWGSGCVTLKTHKTSRKTGGRVVPVSGAAMAILRQQLKRHGSGFLFRTRFGNPYARHTIVKRMLVVSGRLGFRVTAYMLRHTFCTRALEKGIPEAIVAALVGHKGTQMLQRHYNHLSSQTRVLKEAADRISRVG